jgi:hypothetical protein
MLFVPLIIGALVARRVSVPYLLLVVSATAVFIARDSVLDWWRARSRGKDGSESGLVSLVYIGVAAVAGIPLMVAYSRWWFAAFGLAAGMLLAMNARQAVKREDRSIGGEILAISGLTLSAPASYYAATSRLDIVALMLWLMCMLYFTSSVFYVKFRVSVLNRRKVEQSRRYWRHCLIYHSFLLVALVGILFTHNLNLFAFVAFIPVLGRSFWHLAKPATKLNLRRVGILEIIYSIVFLVFTTLSVLKS